MKCYVVVANPCRLSDRMNVIKYTDSLKVARSTMSDRLRWDAVGIYHTADGTPAVAKAPRFYGDTDGLMDR